MAQDVLASYALVPDQVDFRVAYVGPLADWEFTVITATFEDGRVFTVSDITIEEPASPGAQTRYFATGACGVGVPAVVQVQPQDLVLAQRCNLDRSYVLTPQSQPAQWSSSRRPESAPRPPRCTAPRRPPPWTS